MSIMKYLQMELRPKYREYIKNLYSYFLKCDKPVEIAKTIFVYLFEYMTGCLYLVNSKGVENRSFTLLKFKVKEIYGEEVAALVDIMYDIRNGLAHEPFLGFEDIRAGSTNHMKKYNMPGTIKSFCSAFEEDSAKFEYIYKDVMKTLGLMHSLEQEQKQEQEDTTSSLQNDNPLSLDTHYY